MLVKMHAEVPRFVLPPDHRSPESHRQHALAATPLSMKYLSGSMVRRLNSVVGTLLLGTLTFFLLTGLCFAGHVSDVSSPSIALPSATDVRDYQFRPDLFAIRTYQRFISPLLGPRCNFRPSCSRYAAEAIQKYGIVRGTIMAADRLTRCHYCAGLYYSRSKGLLEDPVADNLLNGNKENEK